MLGGNFSGIEGNFTKPSFNISDLLGNLDLTKPLFPNMPGANFSGTPGNFTRPGISIGDLFGNHLESRPLFGNMTGGNFSGIADLIGNLNLTIDLGDLTPNIAPI